MYAPPLSGDQTLCYIHSNAAGESCVNEAPIRITWSRAGETITEKDAMTIVLPREADIKDGFFLSAGENDALLRWRGKARSFSVENSGFLSVSLPFDIWRPIRAAVLTVSDKGSRGEREDTAGAELERLVSALGAVVEDKKIVPDDAGAIREYVCKCADEGYNLVLTTGGTGLSERDVTPEALLSVADKTVPGFGEAMRMGTLAYTPRAFLTRSVAVIRGKTLVIAFPGSRRAVCQCFDAISGALRHGVETLAGWTGECGDHICRR